MFDDTFVVGFCFGVIVTSIGAAVWVRTVRWWIERQPD